MGRGILSGLIWGVVVGGGILVVSNEVVAPRYVVLEAPVPQADAEGPVEGAPDAPVEDESPDLTAEMPAAEPDRSSAQPDDLDAPDADAPGPADDAAAPAPQASDAAPAPMGGAVDPEGEGDTLPDGDAMGETPVLPAPEAPEPQVDDTMGEAPTPPSMPGMGKTVRVPEGADTAPEQPQMPEDGASDIGDTSSPLGEKVGSFTDRADDRISTRLPTISNGDAGEDASEAPVVMADALPALVAYSADFDASRVTGPMMSIVLVDIGELGPEDAAISQLPFPVTFGVDVLAPDAATRARAYRDRGLEVLAMVGLPDGASPQDAAVILDNARATMPVSIGFLDVPSASYQMSRQVAAQVVAAAAETGHAIVTFPRGLNALEQEAKRAGDQPAVLVFRDFDGRAQDVAAMKRFIDQAAFRAGKDGDIVLVGRAKSDTILALAEWALGNRAASVSLVPLSYLLTAQTESSE
ncbi:divergent polysaccharide deacetylase family protein [Celeribacter sp.]|uniref:divergent polysaccharide deacetylase family protein n=1 Tax=Celeribacter sp. TaxID=1890673 RepID=UPI003A8E106F